MSDADFEAALAALRDAPVDVPGAAHREEVRTALLARAMPPTEARSRRWLAAPLAAAAAVIAVVAWPAPALHEVALPVLPPLPARGHVHPLPGAVFTAASHVPDEIVTLHDGTIHLDVDPLHAGERFRVVIGSSEVEVRGTAFEVTADRDRLVDVHVVHGRVEVRPAGHPTVVLLAGGDWKFEASATPVEPVTATPVVVPVAPRPVVHTASLPPRVAPQSVDQLSYNDAWTALRGSQFELAAAEFAKALAAAPDGPLSDDARFWRAVALARGHAARQAVAAFRDLVDEHPGSIHAGEASAMLGWLLVDAKRLDEARERFGAAINDPSAKVRASAQAGIDALDSPKP